MTVNTNLTRDIGESNSLSFNSFITKNNTTGLFSFGFSGDVTWQMTLQSGVIKVDSNKLYNYNTNETVNISGQINNSGYDIFINAAPLILGCPKNTGNLNKTFINCENCLTEFDLFLSIPTFSLDYTTQLSYISGQSGLQGTISSNKRFVINSGIPFDSDEPFSFSGFSTGLANTHFFYITKTLDNYIDYEMPISLHTSLGQVSFIVDITGIPLPQNYYSVSFTPLDFIYASGSKIYNYQLLSNTGYNLNVSLVYVSGQPSGVLDNWRLETGINQYTMFSYYPDSTGQNSYYKASLDFPSALNSIDITVSYIGTGTNVANLIISGTDYRNYLLTGVN